MTPSLRRRASGVPGLTESLYFSAQQRISAQRTARGRVVFVAASVPVQVDEPAEIGGSLPRARMVQWRDRAPSSSVRRVVLRPVGDALTAVQALRSL